MTKTRRRLVAGALCAVVAFGAASALAIADPSGSKPGPPADTSLSAEQQLKQQHSPGTNGAAGTKPQPPAASSQSAQQQLKQQPAPGGDGASTPDAKP